MFKMSVRTLPLLALIPAALGLTACGKSTADVTLRSQSFTSSGGTTARVADSSSAMSAMMLPSGALAAPVTSIKFCVGRIKLEDESGGAKEFEDSDHKGDNAGDGSGELKVSIGLIDLSAGAAAKDWGAVTIPTGFKLSKLKIKIKKDKDLCPTMPNSSIEGVVNGTTVSTDQDIELKFKFDPALDVDSAKNALSLSFNSVVTALNGMTSYTNNDFKNALDSATEGSAKDED